MAQSTLSISNISILQESLVAGCPQIVTTVSSNMSTYNVVMISLTITSLIAVYQYIRTCCFPKIPPTTGQYSLIGVRYVRITPYLRCKFFYPADSDAIAKLKLKRSGYLTDPDVVISAFARVTSSGAWRIKHIEHSNGPFYLDAPIVPGANKFPVVVYSHGLGANFDIASAVCVDMASHGNIVVCIEHGDGSASCTRLGNGSVLFWDGFSARQTLEDALEPDSQEHVSAIRKFREPQLLHRVKEVRTVLAHLTAAVFEAEHGHAPTTKRNVQPASLPVSNDPNRPPIVLPIRGGSIQLAPIQIPEKAGRQQPKFLSVETQSPTPPPTENNCATTYHEEEDVASVSPPPLLHCLPSCIHSPRLPTRMKESMECQRDVFNHYLKWPLDTSTRMDLKNVILMGHSFGGATVITAAGDVNLGGHCGISVSDDSENRCSIKIRGVIAHDPWMQILPPSVVKFGLSIPLLTIFSEQFMAWTANMLNAKEFAVLSPQSVWMYIKGTKHWSFTDIVFWFEWFFIYFSGTAGASSRHKTLQMIRKLDADFADEVVTRHLDRCSSSSSVSCCTSSAFLND